ncbi:MAG: hypothetical protein ACQETH_02205 [Candidatus Rifleibacteriota bacterium]
MREIFDNMVFRAFSYEDDPEAIVDMHRCAETLEGSWFDAALTCKLHSKMVTRTPGSTWVVTYGNIIFAHADLIKSITGEAVIVGWRIHTDYHYPQVARKLLEGLKLEANKRKATGLIIFADNSEVVSDLSMIGCRPDREYAYIRPGECEKGIVLDCEKIDIHPDDLTNQGLYPFLGSPLPPAYLNYRAVMAAEQGVFHYRRPSLYQITVDQQEVYIASFDGREWHVFKKGDFKGDKDLIASLLKTIASINPARILLNKAAIEAAEVLPATDGVLYDYYKKI